MTISSDRPARGSACQSRVCRGADEHAAALRDGLGEPPGRPADMSIVGKCFHARAAQPGRGGVLAEGGGRHQHAGDPATRCLQMLWMISVAPLPATTRSQGRFRRMPARADFQRGRRWRRGIRLRRPGIRPSASLTAGCIPSGLTLALKSIMSGPSPMVRAPPCGVDPMG